MGKSDAPESLVQPHVPDVTHCSSVPAQLGTLSFVGADIREFTVEHPVPPVGSLTEKAKEKQPQKLGHYKCRTGETP